MKKIYLILLSLIISTTVLITFTACNFENNQNFSKTSTILKTEDNNLTLGQKNALAKAKIYLNTLAFSKLSLIDQLVYEKYTIEDATFAANNCGANWFNQAKLKAKSYLDIMPYSKQELIDQLLYEKFTKEEANYAVKAIGY